MVTNSDASNLITWVNIVLKNIALNNTQEFNAFFFFLYVNLIMQLERYGKCNPPTVYSKILKYRAWGMHKYIALNTRKASDPA